MLQVFQGLRWLGEGAVLTLELVEEHEGRKEEEEMEEQEQLLELLVDLHLLPSGGLEHLCTQEQRQMTKSLKDRRLLILKKKIIIMNKMLIRMTFLIKCNKFSCFQILNSYLIFTYNMKSG